jgi:hypothetical protein
LFCSSNCSIPLFAAFPCFATFTCRDMHDGVLFFSCFV